MGNDKIWRLCLKMGIPCVLAQVVNLLYNIVDRIYIGHMPEVGDAALGGLGLCAPVLTFIAAFSSFVSGGGAPLSAKALGEGDEAKAKKYLNNGFFLLIVFSVVLGLTAFACAKPLLYAIGAGDSNFGYAYDYLTIYLIGTLFVQLATGLNTFLTAQGKSITAMVSVIIGAALNIALDPLFIFTLNMGVSGAALATVISQFASACFVVAALMSKKLTVRIDFKLMRPELKIIGAIASLGLQSAMMLITTPITGFTQGVTPILSFNFGAKHNARLKKCYFFTLAVCFGWCTLLSAIMMCIPRAIGMIFAEDQTVLALTQQYLPIFIAGMLIFGVQRACQTTFVAVTEAKISLFIAVLRKIILLVPLAYLLPIAMGVGGVYWAECIADATAAIICGTIFFFRFRRILAKIDDPDEKPVVLQAR